VLECPLSVRARIRDDRQTLLLEPDGHGRSRSGYGRRRVHRSEGEPAQKKDVCQAKTAHSVSGRFDEVHSGGFEHANLRWTRLMLWRTH
jgi:hypothetical protein